MKYLYQKKARVMFVHSGSVLSITGGKGYIVEATSSLSRKGRADRGIGKETDPPCKMSQLSLKIWCGQSLGLWCLSVLLPHRSQRKGLTNRPPIELEEQRRRRTELQMSSGTWAKRPKDVVAACEVSAHNKKSLPKWDVFRKHSMSILGRKTGRREGTARNCFWKLLLNRCSVYYSCPSAVPIWLPLEGAACRSDICHRAAEGGWALTHLLADMPCQLVQSHFQPHISLSTCWGESACAF